MPPCYTSLKTLHKSIRRPSVGRIRCPQCEEVLSPSDYYFKHARTHHRLDVGKCCLFCVGRYSWRRGERLQPANVEHVERCLQAFLHANRVRTETIPICPCSTFVSRPLLMRGRNREPIAGFYETHFEQPGVFARNYGIRFDPKSGLGSDLCAILRRYVRGDLTWIHVMVKAEVFETFVTTLTPIRQDVIELPFGCLCDGRKGQTHRHMILAYPKKSEFMTLWQSVQDDAALCQPIQSAYHLIRTIQYVSTPKATCHGGIPTDLVKAMHEGQWSLSHFCILRPLSEHAIVFLALLIPNGMAHLLREQTREKRVVEWEACAVSKWKGRGEKWCVPIRTLGWKFENCVIPVDPLYEPTDKETEFGLRLHGDTKLFFKKNPALQGLSKEEWVTHQVRKGNTLRSIQDEYYVLALNQQTTMDQLKELKERTQTERDAYWRAKMEE